jgi:dienelactone hydrolase
MLKTQLITYSDHDTTLEAYCVHNDSIASKKPIVLIFHDWSGRNLFAEQKAHQIAKLGWIGLAVDMYGKGKTGQTKEEKNALMQPLIQNRSHLQRRTLAALQIAKQIEMGDTNKIGAIGFCFGGLCALDLARTGEQLCGVASFHGLLNAPELQNNQIIRAKILALHGYDDPMVPPQELNAFAKEMNEKKADWQIHIYGNTMHAFTNPDANDPEFGTVYNKSADTRSWFAMKAFFEEIFLND